MSKPMFDVVVRGVESGLVSPPVGTIRGYQVAGPGGVKWSIWDHGDELSVNDGPLFRDRTVAIVPVEACERLSVGEKWGLVCRAATAIHTAKLIEELGQPGPPNFGPMWRASRG